MLLVSPPQITVVGSLPHAARSVRLAQPPVSHQPHYRALGVGAPGGGGVPLLRGDESIRTAEIAHRCSLLLGRNLMALWVPQADGMPLPKHVLHVSAISMWGAKGKSQKSAW